MFETFQRETSFGSGKPAVEITFRDVDAPTDLDELRRQASRHVLGRQLTVAELNQLAQQRRIDSPRTNEHEEIIPGLRYHPTSQAPVVYERFDSSANRTALLKFDPRSAGSEAVLVLISPRSPRP